MTTYTPRVEQLTGLPAASLPVESGHRWASIEEFRSLRQEILIRVIFQNVLLVLCWCALGAVLAASYFAARPTPLLIYSVLAVSAAAMWAHHGCRTAQIRTYLQSRLEPWLGGGEGPAWEQALEGMQFRSILGSRWFVSTKGFLLGSQVLIIVIVQAYGFDFGHTAVASTAFLASIWLLHEPELGRRNASGNE